MKLALAVVLLALTPLAHAAEPTLDTGNTAWMICAAMFVLMMCIPGLALFYGSMVRAKNFLSVFTQLFAVAGLIGILWVLFGYSLVVDTRGMVEGQLTFNSFIGGLDKALMLNIGHDSLVGTIPEGVFAVFQLTANEGAGVVMLATMVAACAGIVGWLITEKLMHGRPTALGAASGALAGLVGITPACAFVGPLGALVIGLLTGAICFFAVTRLKQALGYDDSLDVFGLHGVGGMVGALLTGVFAAPSLGGYVEGITPLGQALVQLKGVAFTFVYCFVVSWAILGAIKLTVRLRASREEEEQGLDLAEHNERAYNL
jgi:ammonia channel protein AmtB